jgi:glycosyltransferase involved in cell wall biosynthesis
MTRHHVHVNLFAGNEREYETQDSEMASIVHQPIEPAMGGILLGYPTNYHLHINPLIQFGAHVAITMFESSKIPDDWSPILNKCDAVIVPSNFCRESFMECGVKVPVHVIPLGLGDDYMLRAERVKRRDDKPITFLAFLDRGMRKGGLHALPAFVKAFGDDTHYRLILKSRNTIQHLEFDNPNIDVIQRDMTVQEMQELFTSADVMIDANMGEGFGMLGRQFAVTGGITLSTAWGGTADDLSSWGWPLPYDLVTADWANHKNLEGRDLGVWAKPNLDAIAHVLRDVADHIDDYGRIAYARASQVQYKYSWDKFALGVMDVWRKATNGN